MRTCDVLEAVDITGIVRGSTVGGAGDIKSIQWAHQVNVRTVNVEITWK